MATKLICPSCEYINRTSSQFCGQCGQALHLQCPECKTNVKASDNFCSNCGFEMSKRNTETEPPDVSEENMLERRQMTVMFCDMRDFTRYANELDPEDLRRVMRRFQDICVYVILKYGGYISRYMGDGLLVLFGYPAARDDDALRAVRTALEIVGSVTSQEVEIPGTSLKYAVRIGIATGVVIAGDQIGEDASQEQTVIGITPNLAARLQSEAKTNSVLISDKTYRLVQGHVIAEKSAPLTLNGFSQPQTAYIVSDYIDTENSVTRGLKLSDGVNAVFVNRVFEFDHLKQCWQQAIAGKGGVVLIQGDAGIGKSRLIREFRVQGVTSGTRVLHCRCSSHLSNTSLHPVFELFRSFSDEQVQASFSDIASGNSTLLNKLQALSEIIAEAEQVEAGVKLVEDRPFEQPFDALIEYLILMSSKEPLLFIMEDFHWADPSTAQFIDLLVDPVRLEKIMLIVASRPSVLPDWTIKTHVTRLNIDKLSSDESAEIVNSNKRVSRLSSELVKQVIEKSDGVPLYVEELTQSLLDGYDGQSSIAANQSSMQESSQLSIPETLRDSLMSRIDQLGSAKAVAQIAAVIGREFTYELLQAISTQTDQQLQSQLSRLVGSELVYQRGYDASRVFFFKHSLVQEAAYDSLIVSARKDFHRRIASVMAEQFSQLGFANPEVVARHFSLADNHASAARHWNLASKRALQQSAYAEALHHASSGMDCIDKVVGTERDNKLQLELYINLSAAISGVQGDAHPDIERLLGKAQLISDVVQDPGLDFQLKKLLRSYYQLRGPISTAKKLGAELLKYAEHEANSQILTDTKRSLGWSHVCNGELNKGNLFIREALVSYDRKQSSVHTKSDTIDPGGVGLANLAWSVWFRGDADEAAKLTREAIALARDLDHNYTLAYTLCMGAAVFQCRNEPEQVTQLTEEAIAVATKRDFQYWIAWAGSLKAWAGAQLHGVTPMRLNSLKNSLAGYKATGANLFVPYILGLQAETLMLDQRHADAEEMLHRAYKVEVEFGIQLFAPETQRLSAIAAQGSGNHAEALRRINRAIELARSQHANGHELRIRATQSYIVSGGDSNSTKVTVD